MYRTLTLATACLLSACSSPDSVSDSMSQTNSAAAAASTGALSREQWTALASTRVYFGHQSVGSNILEGLRELGTARSDHQLSIVRSREPATDSTPAILEFLIGQNGAPETKIDDFAEALARMAAADAGVAMFKFCYLDITPDTDVQQLFQRHREAVRAMRTRHPNLTFVHVTAPLTTLEAGPRYLVKRMLGKATTREANAKRNRFNTLLREEYAGEPIFDLATVESTRPDGSRSFFTSGTDTIYTLAPEFTDDGGHLNELGRRVAAVELAAVIARAATPAVHMSRAATR